MKNNNFTEPNVFQLNNSHVEHACLICERSGLSHQHIKLQKERKLASLNGNGLRSTLNEIKLLIRSLDIHVIALNEAKLDLY